MSVRKPTQVCISIDTEFSIAGHFDNPDTDLPVAEPAVYGSVAGREEGLGFMLDTFARHDIKATFFVECANYFYFGDEPMRGVVDRLKAARQDIQLHVHPVWLSFNRDPDVGIFPRHDDCAGRGFDELKQVFAACIAVFERWVGERPVAIRTGSLRVDENVYRVMRDLEVPLSSNIGLGVFKPREQQLHWTSGRHLVHGVMEVPLFSYRDTMLGDGEKLKSLQITSCSWPEMRHLLWRARRAGIENIVLLTHPFEFIKKRDYRYREITRNRINQQRLQKLCAFIQQHPEDFVSVDFGSRHEEWLQSELDQPCLAIPSIYAMGRKLHNRLNDLVWSY